jgi:4-hydroxy-3-polyprenylbenzoate decarboxylase
MSGATGAVFGIRLLEVLREVPEVETHLVISPSTRLTIALESDYRIEDMEALADEVYRFRDIAASISSGSFKTMGMVVIPCSMKTLSGIAMSFNDNLLLRAADVTLKERRRLVLVPRETPLHLGHLRLMVRAAEIGAVIMPPMPAFYHRPKALDDIVNQTVNRVLDLFDIELPRDLFRRWTGPKKRGVERLPTVQTDSPEIAAIDAKYLELYTRARPYLDTRENDVHTRIVYHYARRLLELYPDADEEVVLPAVILHDVGWKAVPEERQLEAFGPHIRNPELQRVHEVEGARIAREILTAVNYDPVKREEIVAIIEGHDTRPTAISLNDQLVKDADKLFRFSETGIRIDHRRFGIELQEYFQILEDRVEKWFFTPEAKQIARESLQQARVTLTQE